MLSQQKALFVASKTARDNSADEAPFEVYVRTGLASQEVQKKLQQYGFNEIPEKKVNPFRRLLGYFWGPIPWMIEAAIMLSIIIQHWEDAAIIFTLLIVNAVVGFWQENKADNAIELLKKRLAPKARVLRDSAWREIPARELVPGDIVRVRLGDIVPADIKLMKGQRRRLRRSFPRTQIPHCPPAPRQRSHRGHDRRRRQRRASPKEGGRRNCRGRRN